MTTTKEIQQLLCKAEVLKFNHPCENVKYLFGDAEMDVVSLNKGGLLTEFEVKVSRADFIADKRKTKWMYYTNRVERQICNYFVYVCPEGLIEAAEMPDFAGLIYVIDDKLKVIKKPKLLHRYRHDKDKILTKFCTVMTQRMYLGGCRMTYDNNCRTQKQQEYENSIARNED